MGNIHPSAIIDPSSVIDPTAEIGPYVVIGPNCVVGAGCVFQPFSRLVSHVTLGENVTLHSHAVIGDIPQHLAYKEFPGRVEIGDGTTLREGVTIHRPFEEEHDGEPGVTRLGKSCYLMGNTHVAHDCRLDDGVTMVNGALLAGHVEVGEKAIISGNAAVHQFIKIGRLAMLSGQSALTMAMPPFTMAWDRNKLIGLNVIGLRRAGFTAGQRKLLKKVLVVVLGKHGDIAEYITAAQEELIDPAAPEDRGASEELINWLQQKHSKGILRLPSAGESDE